MKKIFKVFTLFFLVASATYFLAACSKETVTETETYAETEAQSKVASSQIVQPTVEAKKGYNDPPPPFYDPHIERASKYVLSNVPSTGIAQIYTTDLENASSGPDGFPDDCYRAVFRLCNSIMVTGVPGVTGSLELRNAIGLAVGVQNFTYITTGNNSGLASNSLFRINLTTSTGVFIAKTKTATGVPIAVQDIECVTTNSSSAYGIVNNQLAILNLTTGIYTTTNTLTTGVYSGLTVTNDNTLAVFMPNHFSGTTYGGYRTVNTSTLAVSSIINWNNSNPAWIEGDGGFANTPTSGLRFCTSNTTFPALTSGGSGYIILAHTCIAPFILVPVFDYTNY